MMGEYTVTEIRSARPWPSQEDCKVIYYDFLIDGEEKLVNTGRKPGNPLTVGTKLTGSLEAGDRGGLKFVRAQNNGGGGRARDPKESAVIVQQHSQAQALRWAELQHARGQLDPSVDLKAVLKIAAIFAADAKAATP